MQYSHSFRLPYCLVIEDNAFSRLDVLLQECIPDIKQQKILLVTEEFLQNLFADTLAEIRRDLEDCEIYLVEDSTFDIAVNLAKYVSVNGFDACIGFGGGKVLDVAKYASFVAKIPYICLPTTLTTDSLASPFSVMATDGFNRKTFGCKIPTGIIVDTEVIRSAPEDQLKAGIGDTISKYTALYDWRLDASRRESRVDDFAYMISDMAFNAVAYTEERSLKSRSFIRILTQALVFGGLAMEIAGSSRPCSGAEHLFCHALEEFYPQIKITHGMAVAMGSIPVAILQERDVSILYRLCGLYGLDINPEHYGITEDIFVDCLLRASSTRKDRYTILSRADLSKKRLAAIYENIKQPIEIGRK